jgi:hypothetical protein
MWQRHRDYYQSYFFCQAQELTTRRVAAATVVSELRRLMQTNSAWRQNGHAKYVNAQSLPMVFSLAA